MGKANFVPCGPDEPSRLVCVRLPADVFNDALEIVKRNVETRLWGAPMSMTQYVVEAVCRYTESQCQTMPIDECETKTVESE